MSIVTDAASWLSDGANWSGEGGIPNRVLEHVGYTSLTIAVAAAVAVPLGLYIGHTGRLRGLAIGVTGALRALPTLGVLTMFTLLLGIGLGAPTLALVILAVPPLLAGVYSGVESVDPQTVDAARAQGMTEWQILTKVEVPLGLPLVVGGFRAATLQVVATATVAAYVSLGGLGRYIFDGQAVRDYPQMVGGSVVVVVLALLLDGLFAAAQGAAARNARPSRGAGSSHDDTSETPATQTSGTQTSTTQTSTT
ncbi:ABC transporter permease [Aeromicrobium sp. 50.2.37]|uniref:ABC transporter permease n=1 Tax=Aeromicrobium sp. 50.2.37 TaxID=2969305 RepID=UPI00214F9C83|nr:ABC transporter permease [Aeromicrobium sp. 50.2.37]MCR4513395.1 ABC transporter permease [Aeromicrobium sp. 50.2.37]